MLQYLVCSSSFFNLQRRIFIFNKLGLTVLTFTHTNKGCVSERTAVQTIVLVITIMNQIYVLYIANITGHEINLQNCIAIVAMQNKFCIANTNFA